MRNAVKRVGMLRVALLFGLLAANWSVSAKAENCYDCLEAGPADDGEYYAYCAGGSDYVFCTAASHGCLGLSCR